jgi:signal peptidase I
VIDEQTPPPKKEKKQKKSSFWRELPILIGVAIVVAVVVRAFVLQTFYIPSESMENTLNIYDRVLVNKLVYDFRDPHRGEVVVFKAPMDWRSDPAEEDFIKRVIALPGDRVVCCDAKGRISVNGKVLDEPYLYKDENGTQDPPSADEFNVVVPPDRLWVMGDHRSQSGDSREHFKETGDPIASTIPVDSVVGRAFLLFWPMSRGSWLDVPETFEGVPAAPGQ